jgi:hypothetical protein
MPWVPRSRKKHGKGDPLYFGAPQELKGPPGTAKGGALLRGPSGRHQGLRPPTPHDPALPRMHNKNEVGIAFIVSNVFRLKSSINTTKKS